MFTVCNVKKSRNLYKNSRLYTDILKYRYSIIRSSNNFLAGFIITIFIKKHYTKLDQYSFLCYICLVGKKKIKIKHLNKI